MRMRPSRIRTCELLNCSRDGERTETTLDDQPRVSLVSQIIRSNGDGIAGHGLAKPRAIAVDSQGNVYVAGNDSDNVFKIALTN